MNLREAWFELLGQIAQHPATCSTPARWFGLLESAYSAADRLYHNLDHLRDVLGWIDQSWGPSQEEKQIAQYAAWFHDAVYNSRASDNEERSAEMALRAAGQLNIAPAIAQEAALWIRRTKTHDAGGPGACAQFLDCDLAILGAATETYNRYAAAIRREYAWVDEAAYRSGRAKVLGSFLARGRIFVTPFMQERLEAQARRNLMAELGQLQ